jgi:hypothetical protein
MNGLKKENLKELFEKFAGPMEAEQAARDICEGERILAESAAPEPDEELIASIKAKAAQAVSQRRTITLRRRIYKATAIAAVFILMTAIGVKLFEKGGIAPRAIPAASIMPDSIWESEYLAEDDENLATLIAEIEQLESDLLAVRLGENAGNGSEAVTDLEIELVEINSNFWKG